ncbi:transient receptor potential cation channel subfamily A member 1-like isoform X2 [Scyliorhinus canicula]|uniref:transient receptor potential cation channel subfamily A member 1-like isoform X2 n=1 Tax=Scyliorhinus canicula TaxID=7830 RepID=UPI0018F7864E|nr:transient receptor potential cation channel subfamily A member 1-like isoform X2 [Scyliorhinus canicula]
MAEVDPELKRKKRKDQSKLSGIAKVKRKYSYKSRRADKSTISASGAHHSTFSGLDWRNVPGEEFNLDLGKFTESEEAAQQLNNALIRYFIFVARSRSVYAPGTIDREEIQKLLQQGAKIDSTDKYGQTLLHEVARNWHVDTATFLIEKGAQVNQADYYGRTALHVAAALNYIGMIELLLKNQANIEARTTEEWQTPFHYAAKYDATNSLQCLYDKGANIHVLDYKQRTPLYLAALYGRDEAALFLLKLGCHADALDVDDQSCMNIMLLKQPSVAYNALNQLHLIDHSNKIQFFYLKYLEPDMHKGQESNRNKTLELIVKYQIFDILKHPVIQYYIDLKWEKYGFFGACVNLLLKFLFIITWTIFLTVVDWALRHIYRFPKDWWRVVLGIVCVTELLVFVGFKMVNFIICKRRFMAWKIAEKRIILQDKRFCHPCWPLEATFIQNELNNLAATKLYSQKFGFLYDCLVIALLLLVILTHVVDISSRPNYILSWLHVQCVAITLPPLWLWNLKHFQPFKFFGPFLAMVSSVIPTIFKFLFIYIQFFVPFAFAYYVIFGGHPHLPEFNNIGSCLFTVFRISVIDGYNYEAMHEKDTVMTYILVGSLIALEAILAMNLLIAMLTHALNSDKSYLQEQLYMQRAQILLSLEKYPYFSTKNNEVHNYIYAIADPIVAPYFKEENITEEEHYLNTVVLEIKSDLEKLIQKIEMDEHNIFLHQLIKMYGTEEIIGNMSTRLSEERVTVILKNVTNLQKAVTVLHKEQDENYNHLKNNIEELCKLFEMELKYKPSNAANLDNVEDRTTPLLKLIKRKWTHRSTQKIEDVEPNKV